MRLAMFFCVGFSATNILVFLHVCHWLRELVSGLSDEGFRLKCKVGGLSVREAYLGRLMRCHACMGFWVGVSLSALYGGFITEYMVLSFPADVIGDGLLLSFFNFLLWVVLRKLGAEDL